MEFFVLRNIVNLKVVYRVYIQILSLILCCMIPLKSNNSIEHHIN